MVKKSTTKLKAFTVRIPATTYDWLTLNAETHRWSLAATAENFLTRLAADRFQEIWKIDPLAFADDEHPEHDSAVSNAQAFAANYIAGCLDCEHHSIGDDYIDLDSIGVHVGVSIEFDAEVTDESAFKSAKDQAAAPGAKFKRAVAEWAAIDPEELSKLPATDKVKVRKLLQGTLDKLEAESAKKGKAKRSKKAA